MAISIETLVRLLEELCQEIQFCLSFESRPARPSPILVGDFAADAYNGYLALAKEACEDPVIQSLPEIKKLGDGDYSEYEGNWGSDPRMHKMREVSFSARRLLALMQGKAESESQGRQGTLAVAVLLEGLGEQIERMTAPGRPGIERYPDRVRSLVEAYNGYLEVVRKSVTDPVFNQLFKPLSYGEGAEQNADAMLADLSVAQSSLLKYLSRTQRRK